MKNKELKKRAVVCALVLILSAIIYLLIVIALGKHRSENDNLNTTEYVNAVTESGQDTDVSTDLYQDLVNTEIDEVGDVIINRNDMDSSIDINPNDKVIENEDVLDDSMNNSLGDNSSSTSEFDYVENELGDANGVEISEERILDWVNAGDFGESGINAGNSIIYGDKYYVISDTTPFISLKNTSSEYNVLYKIYNDEKEIWVSDILLPDATVLWDVTDQNLEEYTEYTLIEEIYDADVLVKTNKYVLMLDVK